MERFVDAAGSRRNPSRDSFPNTFVNPITALEWLRPVGLLDINTNTTIENYGKRQS